MLLLGIIIGASGTLIATWITLSAITAVDRVLRQLFG